MPQQRCAYRHSTSRLVSRKSLEAMVHHGMPQPQVRLILPDWVRAKDQAKEPRNFATLLPRLGPSSQISQKQTERAELVTTECVDKTSGQRSRMMKAFLTEVTRRRASEVKIGIR